ncbi:hypothetical protein TWF694_006344 [Orbilia ellipsospora]|uniref:Clr5 domain-containing protein n=1 Tax=Orbilia ellipsospora TaxID=2528407 RepID=A0AAV9XRJ4_9PEZI
MSEGMFQLWPENGPEKPNRSYLKIENMEQHKKFILAKRKAGMKHKAIVNALKAERDVTIPVHKLKRLLDGWGQCRQSLTKSRKLLIRNGIEERRWRGKRNHNVVLNFSTQTAGRKVRQITKEEIDEIMGVPPSFFKDVKLNSKEMVAVFSTPTPTSGSEANLETDPNPPEKMDIEPDIYDSVAFEACCYPERNPDRLDEVDMHEGDMHEDSDLDYPDNKDFDGAVGTDHLVLGIQPSILWAEEKDMAHLDKVSEDPEHAAEAFISLGRTAGDMLSATEEDSHLTPSKNDDDDAEDVLKIVAQGLNQMSLTEESTSSRRTSTSKTKEFEQKERGQCDCGDNIEHETPFDKYACRKRHHLWDRIDLWKDEAREFLQILELVSQECDLSLQKAAYIISQAREDSPNSEPLPYHIYKQILAEDEESVSRCHDAVEGVDCALLCGVIQNNFPAIANAVSRLSSKNPARYYFKTYAVHLPFVMKRFGPNNFFTALCLRSTGIMLGDLVAAGFPAADVMHREHLTASALFVFNSIGMATHFILLNQYLNADYRKILRAGLTLAYSKCMPSWPPI